jgi:hypothetical protein
LSLSGQVTGYPAAYAYSNHVVISTQGMIINHTEP